MHAIFVKCFNASQLYPPWTDLVSVICLIWGQISKTCVYQIGGEMVTARVI